MGGEVATLQVDDQHNSGVHPAAHNHGQESMLDLP